MKPKYIFPIVLVLCSMLSFTTYNEILEKLGLNAKSANEKIIKNFIGDFRNQPIDENSYKDDGSVRFQLKSFQIPKIKTLSTIASGDKSAAALELCQYVKAYTESPEFAQEYQKLRENAKPTSEPYRMSPEDIKMMQSSIKEAENAMKAAGAHLPAEQKAEMKKAIQQQKDEIERMKDPTPNKTEWEKLYPEDPADMVRKRLNEYLALVKTVDFSAKTSTSGKYQKFVNPEYEKKSLKWKAIYRAGKQANDQVVVFVQNWLKSGIAINSKQSMRSSSYENPNVNQAENGNETSNKQTTGEKLKEKKNKVLGTVKGKLGL